MIPWLEENTPFPPIDLALQEPNGLLAAGGRLTSRRLLEAYRQGIFPWFSDDQPVLWWSPDPRMVLFPEEIRISRSLRKTLCKGNFQVKLDTAFQQVIAACAQTPRPGQDGTWITQEIQEAYSVLHKLGYAHSVETWIGGNLVGGLYGVALGRMFYGESMFSLLTDSSKIAFAHLVRYLQQEGFSMIDCQMKTEHLASFGAREIPRLQFIDRLMELAAHPGKPGIWPSDGAMAPWGA
ncbi:MAG: leucyl/phenylalanyl-tRNA--protein transferase [Azovibrio sp.]